MKKKLLIALAMCMALGTGCGTETVEEEKKLRSVEITTVGKGEIASEFAYTGRAAASKTVAVIPMVPGKVMSYNFEVGDSVEEGAVLFQVDSTDLVNNLRSVEANYKATELGVNNAKTAYENNKLLFDEEIISKSEYDQIKYAYESAAAGLEVLKVQMDTLNKNIADCAVKAPISGVIATRGIERGGMAAQTAPAYTVMDLSVIKVE
ncbi:MAG: efflux RND transporter periplasmic adaptor subunit, partial [Anaerotignum sp.]|nr:efflux RND transporter periplasmic adaptor subunit [Anaerotignum sp.]